MGIVSTTTIRENNRAYGSENPKMSGDDYMI